MQLRSLLPLPAVERFLAILFPQKPTLHSSAPRPLEAFLHCQLLRGLAIPFNRTGNLGQAYTVWFLVEWDFKRIRYWWRVHLLLSPGVARGWRWCGLTCGMFCGFRHLGNSMNSQVINRMNICWSCFRFFAFKEVSALHFTWFNWDNSVEYLSCHLYILQDLGQPLALNASPFDAILMLVVAL